MKSEVIYRNKTTYNRQLCCRSIACLYYVSLRGLFWIKETLFVKCTCIIVRLCPRLVPAGVAGAEGERRGGRRRELAQAPGAARRAAARHQAAPAARPARLHTQPAGGDHPRREYTHT